MWVFSGLLLLERVEMSLYLGGEETNIYTPGSYRVPPLVVRLRFSSPQLPAKKPYLTSLQTESSTNGVWCPTFQPCEFASHPIPSPEISERSDATKTRSMARSRLCSSYAESRSCDVRATRMLAWSPDERASRRTKIFSRSTNIC